MFTVPAMPGGGHCINRCVRRAFLCGLDDYAGRSFEHRREWVRERVKELCGIFALEVCAYAVMSNHVHLVVQMRPEVAAGWSDLSWMLRTSRGRDFRFAQLASFRRCYAP